MEAQKGIFVFFAATWFLFELLLSHFYLFTYTFTPDYATETEDKGVSKVGPGRVDTIQDDAAVITRFWKAVEFHEFSMWDTQTLSQHDIYIDCC